MPNQIVLAWDVSVAGSPLGPTEAAAKLAAVDLYASTDADPVLGAFLGLTVVSDVSAPTGPATATRTLTLQMTASDTPPAPPAFPCRPRTAEPPELPFPLLRSVGLEGSFFVTTGLISVPTAQTQQPSLNVGERIQFLAQQGVFYEVASVGPTSIGLTAAYTGVTGNTTAAKEVEDPAARVAFYSTSIYDTNGVSATDPAVPAGPGARTVALTYMDSTGAGPFTVVTALTGRRPAEVALNVGSLDVAEIVSIVIATTGDFDNSVGQITLCELSDDLPAIPAGTPVGTNVGAMQSSNNPLPVRTLATLTDEAQLMIDRHLAYLPPSFFALSQQSAAAPMLESDFLVTTGSKNVKTTEDLTSALASTNVIEFVSQIGTRYVVAQVNAHSIELETPYSGIDTNHTGDPSNPNVNSGTKGNLGTEVINRRTGARILEPITSAPPSNAQLATLLAQFVAPETAGPPPAPPGNPSTVPTPTFLSGFYTRTLQMGLRGVPVVPRTITFT